MKVIRTEEVTKSRIRVYFEEGPGFVLYKGEARRFHIREDMELTQENYDIIMEELLPKRAKLRAMNLLKSREYTVKQLRDKLETGGYPEKIIEEALAYVASYHYTDDLRYAISYISCHENTRSRRRIEQDLLARGIDRETVEKAWTGWEEEGGSQDEQEMIRKLLEKKHFDPEGADLKEKQRMYGFLMRKGFSGEQVRKAILSAAGEEYMV